VAEAVERAGGRNIAHDLGKPWSTIARETVVARDPEVVLVGMTSVGPDAAAAVAAEPGFDRLSAVRTGRVYAIDPAVLFQHNHRLVDGIELLHRLFHPER
jgi:iron complex transport system substrate-binding protein